MLRQGRGRGAVLRHASTPAGSPDRLGAGGRSEGDSAATLFLCCQNCSFWRILWVAGPRLCAVVLLSDAERLQKRVQPVQMVRLRDTTSISLPAAAVQALLLGFNVLALVFAARKYTQPVKDDIGDKSVFQFQALPEAEQERQLAALRARRDPDDLAS